MGCNIEDTINKIFQVFWLLTSGDEEENGYVVGGRGGQILWQAEVLEDWYGAKAESDLTQNSQVNNEQKTCFNCTYELVLVSTNENQC